MTESKSAEMDLAAFRDDLAALRADVSSLIEHVKGEATDKVQNAAEQIDRGARGICNDVGAEGEVLALLIALGVGYIGARAFLR